MKERKKKHFEMAFLSFIHAWQFTKKDLNKRKTFQVALILIFETEVNNRFIFLCILKRSR
jgi:hypothetical protein